MVEAQVASFICPSVILIKKVAYSLIPFSAYRFQYKVPLLVLVLEFKFRYLKYFVPTVLNK